MASYNSFLKTFSSCIAIGLSVVFAINFISDPYGLRGRGGRVHNDRLVKALKVNRLNPEAVLLGSSGVVRGLDPNHAVFDRYASAYNLGVLGANIYEVQQYFQHSAAQGTLKTAVVGLDFYAFNASRGVRPGFSEARIAAEKIPVKDFLALYFSLSALQLTFNPAQRGAYFNEDGTGSRYIDPQQRQQIFEIEILEDFSAAEEMYWNYQRSPETLEQFREITAMAAAESIDLKVFVPPLHVSLFHIAKVKNLWPAYQQWLKEIVAIHPVWDFAGCNSITTEPIVSDMQHFDDPSHYTFLVGNIILNRLFDHEVAAGPADFGVYVTPDNVEAHLADVKAQCEVWQQQHPQVVNWIEALGEPGDLLTSLPDTSNTGAP
ncbi:hypothetical protein [Sphaerothrix gracilis]|uniref:hypothetical protein n=1 Tax=Sphaerothrix gracilis TaxID=3151835 RepID=UPI0031FC52B6